MPDPEQLDNLDTDDLLRLLIEQQSFFHETIVHELHRQYELQLATALLQFKDDESARAKLTELMQDNSDLDYKTPVAWNAMMQRQSE